MQVRGKTILEVWRKSILRLIAEENIVPTDRNLDTYEARNAVLNICSPLNEIDKLLSFEKTRNKDYNATVIRNYWNGVEGRIKKYPRTSINQFDEVYDKLNQNPYSRHGYISTWVPSVDLQNSYPLCLIGIQFFIRDEKLNMTAILRSNDSWGQALNDIFELVKIQEQMAQRLQLEVGMYSHVALSYHLYTKDVPDAILALKG